MILLIILFTPFLSSGNTWLQKQCIRKYIMIIIISANKFFIKKRSFMAISFLSLKVRFLPIQSKTLS